MGNDYSQSALVDNTSQAEAIINGIDPAASIILVHRSDMKTEMDFLYSTCIKTKDELTKQGIKLVDEVLFISALHYSQSILEGSNKNVVASSMEKLQFYGFFKQATAGDIDSNPASMPALDKKLTPSQIESKTRAWMGLKGMDKFVAMTNYVLLLEQLDPKWRSEYSVGSTSK